MDKFITKSSYYVEYLGWKPIKGLQGRIYTEPVINELMIRKKRDNLPKITIQLNKRELKISRETQEDGKKRRIKCIKYPPIPTKDLTFASQALEPHTEVVACVFLGYNPRSRRYVHAHVYRFDSATTASKFVHYVLTIASVPEHVQRIQKIEKDLMLKGHLENVDSKNEKLVAIGSSTTGLSLLTENSISNGLHLNIEDDLVSLHDVTPFDSITDELKQRLVFGGAPLLLPPKDYDTISRSKGKTEGANYRKCLNSDITGAIHTSRMIKEPEIKHAEKDTDSISVNKLISRYESKLQADPNNNKGNTTIEDTAQNMLNVSDETNPLVMSMSDRGSGLDVYPCKPIITSTSDVASRSTSSTPTCSYTDTETPSQSNGYDGTDAYLKPHSLSVEEQKYEFYPPSSSGNSSRSYDSGHQIDRVVGPNDIYTAVRQNPAKKSYMTKLQNKIAVSGQAYHPHVERNFSFHEQVCQPSSLQEPIADYDLDESEQYVQPNNAKSDLLTKINGNIFTHDFYKKQPANRNPSMINRDDLYMYSYMPKHRSPVRRVNSLYR